MRADFERQARQAQRVMDAEQKDCRPESGLAGRARRVTSQARDMQALNERHKAEDRQFRQAVAARQDFDRAAEVEARRELAQGVKRERGGPDRALTLPCQQLLTIC